MDFLPLKTRITTPSSGPDIISRPGLLDLFSQIDNHKLTVVSAPAGYGKTVALSAWALTRPDFCISWFSLESLDNDFQLFIRNLLSSIRQNHREFGEELFDALDVSPSFAVEPLLIRSLEELGSDDTHEYLIFDDYHLISNPKIHSILEFLIDHIPDNLHLVLSTRQDPPFELARLRLAGDMGEIRQNNLKFSDDETKAFLNQRHGLNLTEDELAIISHKTEGWIACLRLAVLSLDGKDDHREQIRQLAGVSRHLFDYLIEQVLSSLPEYFVLFLFQVSVLDSFNSDLCRYVTGRKDSSEIIEGLEHSNICLVHLDEHHNWFRFHHLFREFLSVRAEASGLMDTVAIQRDAVVWHLEQSRIIEAVGYAVSARDWSLMSGIVENHAREILYSGGHETISHWLEEMPRTELELHPLLCTFLMASYKLRGETGKSLAMLDCINTNLHNADPSQVEIIRGYALSHQAYVSVLQGKHEDAISLAIEALKHLPEDDPVIRIQTALNKSNAEGWLGRVEDAEETLARNLKLARRHAGTYPGCFTYVMTAELYISQLRLREAEIIFSELFSDVTDVPHLGFAYVGRGTICRLQNNLPQAEAYTEKGLSLLQSWDAAGPRAISSVQMAWLQFALGDSDKARFYMDRAVSVFAGVSTWGRDHFEAERARFYVADADVNAATQWLSGNNLAIEDYKPHRDLQFIAQADVLIAGKEYSDAILLLEKLLEINRSCRRLSSVLSIRLLLANAHFHSGQKDLAMDNMAAAVRMAAAENCRGVFLEQNPSFREVLNYACEQKLRNGFLDSLIPQQDENTPDPSAIRQPFVEPLNTRELQILTEMAAGSSNAEIADKLYLSVNTVRWYARQIYGKMNVARRGEAVAFARQLGLI